MEHVGDATLLHASLAPKLESVVGEIPGMEHASEDSHARNGVPGMKHTSEESHDKSERRIGVGSSDSLGAAPCAAVVGLLIVV